MTKSAVLCRDRMTVCAVVAWAVVLSLLAWWALWPMPKEAFGASFSPFAEARGKPSEERLQIYRTATFNTDGWAPGTVVSADPYAVVLEAPAKDRPAYVRVWTGVVSRSGNDLAAGWDELWVDASGKVVYAVTDIDSSVRSFFAAESQEAFKTRSYLGVMPWADIPTDAEAARRNVPKVREGTVFSLYGDVFGNSDVDTDTNPQEIRRQDDIPQKVPAFSAALTKRKALSRLPADIVDHWAKEVVVDLMERGIIEGYEDGTVRPDGRLTRAEFAALLARSLGLSAAAGAKAKAYTDLENHWASSIVEALQRKGILSTTPSSPLFQPNAYMRRIEMAQWTDAAMRSANVSPQPAALAFRDTGGLPQGLRDSLARVTAAGIIGGYPDGTFRPDGLLTRAEAFAVISRMLKL
ncbi:MAG: hypothetical protein BLM47_06375 [Candidatus Reconcilbacillus cellulovorans]|uniref:SLH domain-containing protein n=1 Tax=Candidatus Reconcilbacillus cellulovorans TaxID=1906605 RepID=A0A2A6E0P0_9BACL|nr:MAG: hypothetical protein BLM47_06375 [Candidatus Reconcilbacillus cellulovorans]